MDEDRMNLMGYLPDYLKEFRELREVLKTEETELLGLIERHGHSVDDRFAVSCGEYGISRFEKMLGISPFADDTLESRRFCVLSKWNTAAIYNYAYLEQQLRMLCGEDGFRMHLDFGTQTLGIKVMLDSKNMLEAIKEMVAVVVPCNIAAEVGLLYNPHSTLGRSTHKQLSQYTHKQLREEVILE